MKKRSWIFLILILAGIAAGYAYLQFSKTTVDIKYTRSDYVISAEELISEFQSPEQALQKFEGKVMEVSGKILYMQSFENDLTLSLGTAGTATSIRCSMDTLVPVRREQLKAGDMVRIKGICTGYNEDELLGNDISLNRCMLIKN